MTAHTKVYETADNPVNLGFGFPDCIQQFDFLLVVLHLHVEFAFQVDRVAKDSIEQFTKGGRMDLADKEQKELGILQTFLPEAISEEDLRKKAEAVIQETGASGPKDLGKVMKGLVPQVAGRIDGAVVSRVVKELLSAG